MNSVAFRAQLVSVMDVLSSAAVAEICKLVDEGLAAVRLQIREREAEIGALRERLATACVSSSPAAHIGEKSGTTDKQTQRAQAELLLLKQEGLEHENIWKLESEGRPSRAGFEQREAKEDSKGPSVNTPSAHAEEAGDECRNPQGVSGSSGLETPVKAELVKEDRSQSFREAQAEQPAQTINGVNSRYFLPERICVCGSLPVREDGDLATGDMDISHRKQQDSGRQSPLFVNWSWANARVPCDNSVTTDLVTVNIRNGDVQKHKPFLCKYCGKDFARRSVFETHMRIHTGEKPFSCTRCDRRFSDVSCYRRHQTVHTGEKPFTCTLCGRCFIRSYHLRRHHQQIHMGPMAAVGSGCQP